MTEYRLDPFPSDEELTSLWSAAWQEAAPKSFAAVLSRSLAHVGAYQDGRLVGFVNLAWDGGIHAFILDTTVHPDLRRRSIGSTLVSRAIEAARARGIEWVHVDFEPHLLAFYRRCGFARTEAGLIDLRAGGTPGSG